MQREENMKTTLIESQKNWTNLALDLVGLVKLLTKNIERGVKADSDQIRDKIKSYENFLLKDRDPLPTEHTSVSVSPIPMTETPKPSLDYPAIRKDLILGMDGNRRVAILQALRIKLNVSSLSKRLQVLDDYIDNDIIGCEAGMQSSLLAAEDE